MKKMKNIFGMLMAAVVLAANTAFAVTQENNLSARVTLDAETNCLIVSGTVKADKSRVPLVFVIKEDGNIVWGDQSETSAPVNGVSEYAFEAYQIPKNKLSTEYEVTVSAQFVDETKVISYSYSGIDAKYDILSKIVEYDESKSSAAMKNNVIEAYPEVVGIDRDVYAGLSDTAKGILSKIASAGKYTCPDSYTADVDKTKVDEEIRKFAVACREALVIAKVADIDNGAKLLAWAENDAAAYGLSSDDTKTPDNEAIIYSDYFVKIDKSEQLIARIRSAASEVKSFSELRDLIFDRVLLTYIETGNYSKTKEIVNNLPSKFAGINSSKRDNSVYMQVTGKYYKTIAEFITACNNCTVKNTSGGGGGGGGGGGSSTGVGSTVTIEYPPTDPETNTPNTGFTDMSNHAWAQTAVNYLRDRGIISGKTLTRFAPSENITRAEFAKILVNAMSINVSDYEGEFDDVKASDWYAPFVSAAAKKGIILGSNGRFMPNQNITRQDMAVMIKRTLDLDDSAYKEVFSDSDHINSYAQRAVYAVYRKGIMQGSGNGYFNPLSNATRAEAAQTVYNMLTK